MRVQSILLASVATLLALTPAFAAPAPVDQKVLAEEERRLISLSPSEQQWLTEEEVFGLIRQGKKFIDVTDEQGLLRPAVMPPKFDLPKSPEFGSVVKPIIGNISKDYMKNFLTTLTGFTTRYYKTSSGKEASDWIFDRVLDEATAANQANKGFNITVTKFAHDWVQSSVIARITPAGATDDHVVIVGAHLDSINQWNPYWGRSPGADDDGSGTTTIFEAYRLLLQSGVAPTRPIEFHWYSAEEGGLLGSQKVVRKYQDDGVKIAGMVQVDMTGYTPPNKQEIIGIATDFSDDSLRVFLQSVAKEYASIPWGDVKCGYGCSDHASWNKAGYPAAFTFEAPFDSSSPYIHTANDDITHISFDHMVEFVKLIIGYAVELGSSK
ncbi:hypothetical protein DFS34DRAFT_602993 [Phlyctochytrium arcticum]|nr:hypothetical protein DFS34DRAFT_602993 [Phlyctochytrium arcticum]